MAKNVKTPATKKVAKKETLSKRGLTKVEERARKKWLKILSTYFAMLHPGALNAHYISATNGGDVMDVWKHKDDFLKGIKKRDVKELAKLADAQFAIDDPQMTTNLRQVPPVDRSFPAENDDAGEF